MDYLRYYLPSHKREETSQQEHSHILHPRIYSRYNAVAEKRAQISIGLAPPATRTCKTHLATDCKDSPKLSFKDRRVLDFAVALFGVFTVAWITTGLILLSMKNRTGNFFLVRVNNWYKRKTTKCVMNCVLITLLTVNYKDSAFDIVSNTFLQITDDFLWQ